MDREHHKKSTWLAPLSAKNIALFFLSFVIGDGLGVHRMTTATHMGCYCIQWTTELGGALTLNTGLQNFIVTGNFLFICIGYTKFMTGLWYLRALIGAMNYRRRLFQMINDLPTIYEVVTGIVKKQQREKSASTPNSSSKSKSSTKTVSLIALTYACY